MSGNDAVISAVEFGKVLAEHLSNSITADESDSESGVDPEVVAAEKVYLEIFATDYATYMTFGEDPVRRALMDSFYKNFTGPVTMAEVNEHLGSYARAVQTVPPEKGLSAFWNVGKQFAHYCGQPDNMYLISLGIVCIQRSLTERLDAYQQFRVEV